MRYKLVASTPSQAVIRTHQLTAALTCLTFTVRRASELVEVAAHDAADDDASSGSGRAKRQRLSDAADAAPSGAGAPAEHYAALLGSILAPRAAPLSSARGPLSSARGGSAPGDAPSDYPWQGVPAPAPFEDDDDGGGGGGTASAAPPAADCSSAQELSVVAAIQELERAFFSRYPGPAADAARSASPWGKRGSADSVFFLSQGAGRS